MFLYLIILILVIAGPLALSFEKNLMLYKRWKYLFPAIFMTMVLFGTWDIIFTHIGCWEFNPKYIAGIYLFKLPIEEYLFFISIPYACIFSYYAMKFHFPNYKLGVKSTQITAIILITSSLIIALTNLQRIYTFVDFMVLALVVFMAYRYAREMLQHYLAIFPVLLIPMMLVNGILTGSGIEHEVFSYEMADFSGIHVLTMPIEDVFFAFSLIITSIGFTELLENKFKKAYA